jgi:hypothetical protein
MLCQLVQGEVTMENLSGVVVLLGVLALFPSLKFVAELVDSIGRRLAKKSEGQKVRDHLQEQL